MKPRLANQIKHLTVLLSGLLLIFLNACTFSLFNPSGILPSTSTPPYPPPPSPTAQPMAEITFNVTLPTPLLPGEQLALSMLDEVTGLALNPVSYPMIGIDSLKFTLSIPIAVNSVVKYRYVRQSALPIPEDNANERPIRYRLYYASGPGVVDDVIASWSDSIFSGQVGRVSGTIVDATTGAAIPNILVTAAGVQTLTDSTGSFELPNLPQGVHNLVSYALDGMYVTFQQGVKVDVGRITQVDAKMSPASLVNVIFTLIVPKNTVSSAPLRMAGNLYQLGNTFGDLDGGLSMVASRMPVLQPLPDGRYTISLMLPAGADVRYKYTLGDGFWNAEHRHSGEFVVRQLIVPTSNSTVQDMVETWQAGPSSPILFETSIPSNLAQVDVISIQFNPYGWTEPIPMWPLGNNRWAYQLFSPLNMLGEFEYRYCRNDQCGVADDVATAANRRGRPISTSLTPQYIQDDVTAWTWLQEQDHGSIIGVSVQPRASGFIAGVEFQADYDPSWQAWMPSALQHVQGIYSNWVVLSPTWTYGSLSPLTFSPVPGNDPLWTDIGQTVSWARALNLSVALFPMPHEFLDPTAWWSAAPRDSIWWEDWFARYRAFALYHADLATQADAQALILGGDWIAPALPGGVLESGDSSNVPHDAEARWRNLLAEVRQHFSGNVYWALSYPGGLQTTPAFVKDLSGVYLLWYASLSPSTTPTVAEMQSEAGRLLDTELRPLQVALQKPLILAVAYPSVTGAADACPPDGRGGCLNWPAFNQPSTLLSYTANLPIQFDIYQALFAAVNERSWINGFISRGYFPPVTLQDFSASIHGKPTADVLWYWFPRFLGIVK